MTVKYVFLSVVRLNHCATFQVYEQVFSYLTVSVDIVCCCYQGITLKVNDDGCCIVARIMHGGMIHKQGLLAVCCQFNCHIYYEHKRNSVLHTGTGAGADSILGSGDGISSGSSASVEYGITIL